MKRLLCLLLCAVTICWGPPALADETSAPSGDYGIGDLEGDDPADPPATPPAPDGNSDAEEENDPPATPPPADETDKKEPPPDPPPAPVPPPVPQDTTPGITVNAANGAVSADLSLLKSASFQGNTATFTYLDATRKPVQKTLTQAGCTLNGAPAPGASLVFNSSAPILLAGAPAGAQAYTYPVSGNIMAPAGLTARGTLLFSADASLDGTVTADNVSAATRRLSVNGSLTAGQFFGGSLETGGTCRITDVNADNISVKGGSLTVDGIVKTGGNIAVSGGAVTAGSLQSDGTISVTARSANGAPVVSARQIDAIGNISLSGPVFVNALSGNHSLRIGSGGSLTTAYYDGTLSGRVAVAGDIELTGGSLSAAGDIQAANLAVHSGTLTNQRALALSGSLSVEGGGSIQGNGALQAKNFSLSGPVKGNNLTSADALTIGNTTDLTGTLSAPSLTVNGTLNAASVQVSGDISAPGSLSVKNTLSAGGKLSVGASGRSAAAFSAAKVEANQLYSANALLIPDTELAVKNGGMEIKGELRAKGGSCGGPLSATYVTLTKPFSGADITSTAGAVNAQKLTLSGRLRAENGISLNGDFSGRAIVADHGNITTTGSAAITRADSVEAVNGAVNLGAAAEVDGRIYGRKGITLNGGRSKSIYSDGNVTLRGDITTGSITAGPLSISGNVNAGDVSCTSGAVDSKAKLDCDSVNASAALTVRGSIKASGRVRGNPISTPSGGVIRANTVSGMESGYKGKLTITTPFNNKNIYVELKRSGETAKGFDVKTDRNGKVTFENLASGSYTVYAESGSSARRGTVSVSSSGTTTLDLRSNAGTSHGGQTNGGDDFFDEDEFWDDVYDDIRNARRGDTVRVSASKADSVPVWLLEELQGRPVILKLTHGRDSVTIDGQNMYDIPNNRVYYRFDDLADLYAFPPDASSSHSSQSSSSSPSSSHSAASSSAPAQAVPLPTPEPAPPPAPAPLPTPLPTPPATTTPSQDKSETESSEPADESEDEDEEDDAESSSLASEEESSQPDEPQEPEKPVQKQGAPLFPLMLATALILLSLGGIAIGYVLYRRSREKDSIYDDDDE